MCPLQSVVVKETTQQKQMIQNKCNVDMKGECKNHDEDYSNNCNNDYDCNLGNIKVYDHFSKFDPINTAKRRLQHKD